MTNLYDELAEYTGRDIHLVRSRCQAAVFELAWQWERYKDRPLDFYRETDLYLFDLTKYQSELHAGGWHDWLAGVIKQHNVKSILDFGGGIGESTITASKAGVQEIAFIEVQHSQTYAYAIHRWERYNISGPIELWYEKTQIRGRRFDMIIGMDVLEHMAQPEPVINLFAEIAPLLVANCHHLPFGCYFPQHISHPELEPVFENIEGDLWRRR